VTARPTGGPTRPSRAGVLHSIMAGPVRFSAVTAFNRSSRPATESRQACDGASEHPPAARRRPWQVWVGFGALREP
jgi:hypothetical protein